MCIDNIKKINELLHSDVRCTSAVVDYAEKNIIYKSGIQVIPE